jgi:flagellar capping protein FliD
MDNIKIVRLQSGEDIIASYLEDDTDGSVLLSNPMTLIFRRLPTGKAIMMMAPWLPIELVESNSACIYMADILTVVDPKKSLIDYYSNAIEEALGDLDESEDEITESLESMRNDIDDYDDEMTEEEEEIAMQELEDLRRDVKKRLLH